MTMAATTVGNSALAAAQPAPESRWAIVNIQDPMRVGDKVLMGRYLIVHDDTKMARGEPCTTIYRFDNSGTRREVVAFHCVPAQRAAADRFTFTLRPTGKGRLTPVELVEYQFAGDTEGHGVPSAW